MSRRDQRSAELEFQTMARRLLRMASAVAISGPSWAIGQTVRPQEAGTFVDCFVKPEPSMFKPLVTYLRVSTAAQGKSGLGLDAQREALARFAESAQNNMGGPNQWAGPKFAAQLQGNALQQQMLAAALGALPARAGGVPPGQHLDELLPLLKAQGYGRTAGSNTSGDTGPCGSSSPSSARPRSSAPSR